MSIFLSIHQPAYLPWLGYFHKICISDIFVFFDNTQFEKNSFVNRNKIKTSQGPIWLTVPVKLKNHTQKEIREIKTVNQLWQQKHWKAIELNYKKSKHWAMYSEELRGLYQKKYDNISELCYEQLLLFLAFLGIKTKVIQASNLCPYNSKKSQLVLDICRELGADVYVSGKLGKDYIEEHKFVESGIKLYFQDYAHPTYQQLWGQFAPFMSIIDLLFNCGEKSLEILMQRNITKDALKI